MVSAAPENTEQENPPEEFLNGVGKEARKKWAYALDAGFQIIPDALFRCQKILGLKPLDVVILLNITIHWWAKEDLPHPRPSVIANRTGVTTRTVERRLIWLQENGFLNRLPSVTKKGRAVRKFDLSGLVAKLQAVSAENLKLRRSRGGRRIHVPGDD
jgi:hypothetical protein